MLRALFFPLCFKNNFSKLVKMLFFVFKLFFSTDARVYFSYLDNFLVGLNSEEQKLTQISDEKSHLFFLV